MKQSSQNNDFISCRHKGRSLCNRYPRSIQALGIWSFINGDRPTNPAGTYCIGDTTSLSACLLV